MPAKHLIKPGTVYDHWTVLGEAPGGRPIKYLCRCLCGTEKLVAGSSLIRGISSSCGCSRRESPHFQDLSGQVFGRWIAVAHAGRKGKTGRITMWLCRCECGVEREVPATSLKRGISRSCGCLRSPFVSHGCTARGLKTPEYKVWCGIKTRCTNENEPKYRYYGGRGIMMCERWLDSFDNFLTDMGPRPSPKHEIDRFPNNDGNYDPDNCRWATKVEQANNKRSNLILTMNGESLTLSQWCRRLSIPVGRTSSRLKKGWSVENALTAPKQKPGPKYKG